MTPVLLFPLGLAALTALAIPLLLHLRRRTEAVPVVFAALHWLDPRPRPRRKLRFDDWPLLLARLLLIALLALLLARPAVYGVTDARPRVLVAPGVDARAVAALSADADVRWIAPGFPMIDGAAPPGTVPLASLIRQYDAELPPAAPLTIVVPAAIQGVDADRLRLTRSVRWSVMPATSRAGPVVAPAAPALDVRHPAGAAGAARYFRAAAGAWTPPGAAPRLRMASDDAAPDRGWTLVWLKSRALPAAIDAWIEGGGTALLAAQTRVAMPGATQPVWRDQNGVTLIEGADRGRGRVLRLTVALTPATLPALVEPDFPDRLRVALAPAPPPPDRVAATAYRPSAGMPPYPLPPRELSPWLAIAIALVFVAERWLATRRRAAR